MGGDGGAGRRSDWLRRRPLPAPRAPRHAPSLLPPAASELLPAGGRTRRGGPSPRPACDPARGDKTLAAARGNPRSRWLRSAGRRGRGRSAAGAPAPRTRLPEWGSPRADTRRPGRRGGTFSRAMKRARETRPQPAETFPAPRVAAAAAAAAV